MTVERIEALDIDHRGLFTAIYGINRGDEIYVTSDMAKHNIRQILYLYLREKGFLTVFYDDKAFSYEESQLIEFFNFTPRKDEEVGNVMPAQPVKRDFFKGKGPMCKTRVMQPVSGRCSGTVHHDSIRLVNDDMEHSYMVMQSEGFFGVIGDMVRRDAKRKVAVVFVNPNTLEYDELQQKAYENTLALMRNSVHTKNMGLRIIALYDFQTQELFSRALEQGSDKFLMRPPFSDMILADLNLSADKDGDTKKRDKAKTVFFINDPERDEINNILNRKRLLLGLRNAFGKVPWNDMVQRLWQGMEIPDEHGERMTLRLMKEFDDYAPDDAYYAYGDNPYDKIIDRMDTCRAIDKLNAMQGIDNIKEQFQRYRESLKAHRHGSGGAKFRPHMALLGSPGTGKTTVARLFGEILREDGILPKGQFIKADVSDLVGEYIGSTRPKTRAVCERARGGVLFIDEAYGLMSGTNDHGDVDYGKEAIEVLIQFMEDDDSSLVILAGYTAETTRLIDEGNPGFRRRFNDLGFFYFKDYEPKVLFEISKKMIPVETTPEFDKALLGIIQFKYAYRNKKFGNVGEMENMVNLIVGSYRASGDKTLLDIKHLPASLRILVDADMLRPADVLKDLNNLVGQNNVKKLVTALLQKALADRTRLLNVENFVPIPPRLSYVFSGNPGTGKTTVARIMGEVLNKLGILSSSSGGLLTEITGNDLLTAKPSDIKKLFEDNIGKVLFIDEAYQLMESPRVIADIVGNLTNPDFENKLCLIFAGYTEEMRRMINVNAGMERRLTVCEFEDYSNEELWLILQRMVQNPQSQVLMNFGQCQEAALAYFASLPRDRNFANAGAVDILLSELKGKLDCRYLNGTPEQMADPDFAKRILPEDFFSLNIDKTKSTETNCAPLISGKRFDGSIVLSDNQDRMVISGDDLNTSVGLIDCSVGTGTAFVISVSQRLLLTASHVVENARDFSLTMYRKGQEFKTPLTLLWNNPAHDLALLQAETLPVDVRFFRIDRSTERTPGGNLRIAAYPMGTSISPSVLLTEGIISSIQQKRQVRNAGGEVREFDAILTEAQATHGSSGGPVFLKETLAVIGVLHGGFTEGGFAMNIVTDIRQLFDDDTLYITN